MVNLVQDRIHTYQPTTFNDLGKNENSKHGYTWKEGNILLENAKRSLLRKMQKPKEGKFWDFRDSVNNECFWRIFKDLNRVLEESGEFSIDEAYKNIVGGGNPDYDLCEVIDFTINSALYTSKRMSHRGYWFGNSILYNELDNQNSIIYNLNSVPGFRKRIVNSALWENLVDGKTRDLEKIFNQDVTLLDTSFSDVGRRIQKINAHRESSSLINMDISNISKGAVINLGYFINKLKSQKVKNKEEELQTDAMVQSYLEGLIRVDDSGIPYFELEDRAQLRELVST